MAKVYYGTPKVYFGTRRDAEMAFKSLRDIAIRYGYATIADVKEIAGWNSIHYTDNRFGWTADMLDSYKICRRDGLTGVFLELPHVKYFEDREPDESEENETSTNEYVNITIHTKDVKSPAEYISDILKEVSQIKDRTINITIM